MKTIATLLETHHTPSPWRISNDGNDIEQNYADNGGICALYAISIVQDQANGLLIKNAPDLLQSMISSYADLQCQVVMEWTMGNAGLSIITDSIRATMRNAISLATGIDCQTVQETIEAYASEQVRLRKV